MVWREIGGVAVGVVGRRDMGREVERRVSEGMGGGGGGRSGRQEMCFVEVSLP